MPDEFADTNIVIYASSIGLKTIRARAILRTSPTISVQVLNETLNILRRKQQLDWRYGLSVYDAMITEAAPEGVARHYEARTCSTAWCWLAD
jgi:predicted nucleic acid-binding protein